MCRVGEAHLKICEFPGRALGSRCEAEFYEAISVHKRLSIDQSNDYAGEIFRHQPVSLQIGQNVKSGTGL